MRPLAGGPNPRTSRDRLASAHLRPFRAVAGSCAAAAISRGPPRRSLAAEHFEQRRVVQLPITSRSVSEQRVATTCRWGAFAALPTSRPPCRRLCGCVRTSSRQHVGEDVERLFAVAMRRREYPVAGERYSLQLWVPAAMARRETRDATPFRRASAACRPCARRRPVPRPASDACSTQKVFGGDLGARVMLVASSPAIARTAGASLSSARGSSSRRAQTNKRHRSCASYITNCQALQGSSSAALSHHHSRSLRDRRLPPRVCARSGCRGPRCARLLGATSERPSRLEFRLRDVP